MRDWTESAHAEWIFHAGLLFALERESWSGDGAERDRPAGQVRVWGYGLAAGARALLVVDHGDVDRLREEAYGHHKASRRGLEEPHLISISEDELVASALGRWQLPDDAVVLPLGPPEPLSSVTALLPRARVVRSGQTRERGTACCVVRSRSGRYGFLTAGHVAGNTGGVVELGRTRLWGRRVEWAPIGTVAYASDPIETPGVAGWDAAVVETAGSRGWPALRAVPLPPALPVPLPVTMLGGPSGEVSVEVIASMREFGSGRRVWRDSWLMLPSGTAVQGDSGSAVIESGDRLVGLVVGGSRERGSHAFSAQYVQDADSLCREFLERRGYCIH
ncbi:MAG TPA: hypothetical protein VFJ91_12660 [Gaiellaceae bacterium]|nr:hypothetical protein [Gaiellaceae bacterium]